MVGFLTRGIVIGMFAAIVFGGGSAAAQDQNSAPGESKKLQQRIDFGNSYIMGQSIKSGAVYLLHRKQSEIKSMLHYRENYRQEILEDFEVQDLKVKPPKAIGPNPETTQASAKRN